MKNENLTQATKAQLIERIHALQREIHSLAEKVNCQKPLEEALNASVQAEEALRDEKDFTENVLNTLEDIFFMLDSRGGLFRWNKALKSVSGRSDAEIASMRPVDLFAANDRNRVDEAVRRCVREGRVSVEASLETAEGGRQTPYEVTVALLRGRQGEPLGICGVGRDISERRLVEMKLAEQAKILESFFKNTQVCIVILDRDFNFIRVNEAYARFDDRTPEDFPGHNHFEFYPSEARAIFEEVVATGKPFQVLSRPFVYAEHPERGVTYWDWTLVPVLDDRKQVQFLIFTLYNVTEHQKAQEALRKSESRYRDLFTGILEGVYAANAEGIITMINPAGARMFGFASPEEMIGRSWTDFWADPPAYDSFLSELHRTKSVNLYPVRAKNKAGDRIQLETTSNVLVDEEDGSLRIEGILRDVTDRCNLEAQLRHAQKMEAIGTLAGGVAHDFNNILSVIMGYGNMVLRKLGPRNPLQEQMHEVLAAADRAASLTKQLRIFSRKQVMEVKPVDLNGVVSGVRNMLSRVIGEDIDLQVNLAEGRLTALADTGQLEQVLMNLATNARDAMPRGGHLTIRTGTLQMDDAYVAAYGYGKPGTYAVISVSDTGEGMNAETQAKIFEPFFTTKEIGEGTGLGLAISYGIVKQHGGYIQSYSEPGTGTVFKIYLPLLGDAAASPAEAVHPETIRGGTEAILVAEDDPTLRKLDKIVLESFGYSVIAAEDGEDAVMKFSQHRDRIKLAVLDLIMPKKNGKEVYDEIKKTEPGIRAVFMSGYTIDMLSGMGFEAGTELIRKPIAPNDLVRKVREILDRE